MKAIKKILNNIFIDGLSGMALGLFSTLIIGTILKQIGDLIVCGGFLRDGVPHDALGDKDAVHDKAATVMVPDSAVLTLAIVTLH